MKQEVNITVENTSQINAKKIMKFLIPSLFGIIMFLLPIPYNGTINTPVGVLSERLVSILSKYLPYAVVTWVTYLLFLYLKIV